MDTNSTVGQDKAPTMADLQSQISEAQSRFNDVLTKTRKQNSNVDIEPIPVANAENVGRPAPQIPTTRQQTERPTELDTVGTTTIPQTGTDQAREALVSSVGEEDRDTVEQIFNAITGLQTEEGAALEDQLATLSKDRLNLAESRAERQRERGSMMEEQNIPELAAELEAVRGEADTLKARKNAAIQREAAREGVSSSARANNLNSIERNFQLKEANLAIRELAAVGKVNAANALIQTKLDIKYGDIQAETELVTAQINAIMPLLSREDKKVAEQRMLLNDQARAIIADSREQDKILEEFKLQSYQNAQANGASPAVLSQIMSSTNREDVLRVGGSFVEDPTEILQRTNLRGQIKDRQLRRQQEAEAAAAAAEDEQEKQRIEDEAAAEGLLGIGSVLNNLSNSPGMSSAVGFGVKKSGAARTLTGAGTGAAVGAGVGSVVPVLGTAIGGGIGAIGGGIVGYFAGDEAFEGSSRADFETQATRLSDMFLVENLDKMTGVLTDKDLEVLRSEGTTIGNFNQSEQAWMEERDRLLKMVQRGLKKHGITPEQAEFYGYLDDNDSQTLDAIWNNI